MAINVFALGKLKNRYTLFQKDHPDVMPYLKSLIGEVREGASVELKMTSPDGRELSKRITLNPNDVETFRQLKDTFGK